MHRSHTGDRRVRRTEALLRGALGELIGQKPYDDIVVKEILSRANVGRSTFYTHFAGKDDLLHSCIHDLLQSGGQGSARPLESILRFSIPIFEHIERHRRSGQAIMEPTGRRAVHHHLERAISELIGDEIRTALRHGSHGDRQVSADLLARWIASTFVLVLNWWVDSESPLSAREADALFRALTEPSLAGRLGLSR